MIHETSSELAGSTVKIKSEVKHPHFEDFGGSSFIVEDWWDKLSGKSWMFCDGNPACLVYVIRCGLAGVPLDDEVLYGKTDNGLGHLAHVSEIDRDNQLIRPNSFT